MARGTHGAAVQWALESQIATGRALGATHFVPVTTAHMMGDIEVLGVPGFRFLKKLAEDGAQVRVPTTTNARCVDFAAAGLLRQDAEMVSYESRLKTLLASMGIMLTDTCINYQTVYQPRQHERIAWGDTGTVIYANSVFGARSNFESGPAALAAGLTGRTPAYGFQLDAHRRGTVRILLRCSPSDLSDWGAIGAAVGRQISDYWTVPVFVNAPDDVGPDALKHLGAALASYGSLAMFHVVGATPEAPDERTAFDGHPPERTITVDRAALQDVYASYPPGGDDVGLVVMTGPQLSIFELRAVADLISGQHVARDTTFILTTNAQNRQLAKELGYLDTLRQAGVLVLTGTCFYLMNVPAMRDTFGWTSLVTNSAKLANIVGGYEIQPTLLPTPACVEAAVTGRTAP